jgi:ribonucleotide reductase beta subunit family protein with ferritin-like domain
MTTPTKISAPPSSEKEVLTIEDKGRFIMYPIKYPKLFGYYKKAASTLWFADEIEPGKDLKDWRNLTKAEQRLLKFVLAFFAGADGIVGENIIVRFYSEIQAPEIRAWYAYQLFVEQVHSEVYSNLLQTYVQDEDERMSLFRALESVAVVQKKCDWTEKWIGSDASLSQRVAAFVITEGLFFSSSFASIFYFKERGILNELCLSNEFISRDEGMHTFFGIMLYDLMEHKSDLKPMFVEAVAIEKEFVREALGEEGVPGMAPAAMEGYVEYVADQLFQALQGEKIYNTPNPLGFMEMIGREEKKNFFERTPSEYTRMVPNSGNSEENLELTGEDF